MWAFFTATSLGRNIAAIGALLIAGLAIAGALLSRGAANERSRTRERTLTKTIKHLETRNEVERSIDRGGSVRERLHRDWTRP